MNTSTSRQTRAVRDVTLAVRSTLDAVSALSVTLSSYIAQRLDSDTKSAIELGITEALVNVVKHGYPAGDVGLVELQYVEYPDRVMLRVKDHGIPIPSSKLQRTGDVVFHFDPLDMENVPESGMGIAIIKASFDDIDYVTGELGNTLTLIKNCAPRSDG